MAKPFTFEDFPFGEDVHVFKVKKKMFATLALGKMAKENRYYWMNLKCDPHEAAILRDIFSGSYSWISYE